MAGGWQRTTPPRERSSWAWQKARAAALARDGYQCTAMVQPSPTRTGTAHAHRCTAAATEVDHIAGGDDHTLPNLASLCTAHHRVKTQHEAAQARWQHRMRRAPEPHPGLLS